MDSRGAASEFRPRLLLSLPEVAAALGLSQRTVRGLIYKGQLSSCRVGSRRLVAVDDLEDYVKSLREHHAL